MSDIPLSHSDLLEIAKHLREWERLLTNDSGGYNARADLVTRIEVTRPWCEDEVIGHFVLYDGWVGFRPIEREVSDA